VTEHGACRSISTEAEDAAKLAGHTPAQRPSESMELVFHQILLRPNLDGLPNSVTSRTNATCATWISCDITSPYDKSTIVPLYASLPVIREGMWHVTVIAVEFRA
jgi:hypothetical protein